MKTDWKLLSKIFLSFLKIGPVTFGGGYAMIPLIEREVVIKRKWLKMDDVSDVFAMAESVPGAIAINSATFIGHRIAGTKGAVCAMLGTLFPTFLVVMGISTLFFILQGNHYLESAFLGIRPAIVALIVYAGVKISKTAIFDKTTLGLTIAMLSILLFTPLHPILIILSGIILGIGIIKLKEKLGLVIQLESGHSNEAIMTKEGES
ncbi:chromate transporter [Evansella tamaricis]|uniref:Chromate transporter n=1 Tax=Evansella tamaricis TaxID=2069301 RepID=A0ABS6JG12_9BACI|nr:chromate transporter [Evansella tamaricis]MBU9712587.1 chromate transporter [Evansella tamaricis]